MRRWRRGLDLCSQEERKRGREIQALENRISSKPLPLPETREAQQARVKSRFKFFDTHESMLKSMKFLNNQHFWHQRCHVDAHDAHQCG